MVIGKGKAEIKKKKDHRRITNHLGVVAIYHQKDITVIYS